MENGRMSKTKRKRRTFAAGCSHYANIVFVNVISKRGLQLLLEGKSTDVAAEITEWYRIAHAAQWAKLEDVREHYPSVDQVGIALIFNIRHNRYRLITRVEFHKQKLYVKALLTHKEYDRGGWKRWA
jgi:mRNA interferase HigB